MKRRLSSTFAPDMMTIGWQKKEFSQSESSPSTNIADMVEPWFGPLHLIALSCAAIDSSVPLSAHDYKYWPAKEDDGEDELLAELSRRYRAYMVL